MSGWFPAILALSLCGAQAPDEDPFERREIARLTGLLEKLPASKRSERVATLQELEDIGAAASSAVPAVIRLLKDKDVSVRRTAVGTLKELRALPDLSVPALFEALGDHSPLVREAAASSLSEYKAQAASILPRLVAALEDGEPGVRAAVVGALTLDGSGKYLPHVVKRLGDDDESVRCDAAGTLAKLGMLAKSAEPMLAKMLKKEREIALCNVAHALWRVSGKPASAIEALTSVIEKEMSSEDARIVALLTLKEMGDIAGSALPAIKKSLTDENLLVRCEAAALREALKDKDGVVRVHAARLLWGLRIDREAAKTTVMEALVEKSGFASLDAAELLGEMGAEAAEAIPQLVKLEKHEVPSVRRAARDALAKIRAAGK